MTQPDDKKPAGLVEIETYWRDASKVSKDADGLRPTARDPSLQELVETAVEKWIWPQAKLFDVGCGDGLSTIRFARRAGSVVGMDYIDSYVETATANARAAAIGNASFRQGDVLDLSALRNASGKADIVVTIRCLINLPDWDHHRRAIEEIARTIKPGGLYILSEGWSEGWDGINLLRVRAGLEPMTSVRYNAFLSRRVFDEFVADLFDFVHYENLGFYLAMSRVFQPLLVRPESPRHNHPLNGVAAEMLARGIGTNTFADADYAGVYVLRRK
jgi:SAM-dependent methyltransferase